MRASGRPIPTTNEPERNESAFGWRETSTDTHFVSHFHVVVGNRFVASRARILTVSLSGTHSHDASYRSRKLASFIALAGADRGAAFVASPSAIVHTKSVVL